MAAGLGSVTATVVVFLVVAVRRHRHAQQCIEQGDLDPAGARESRLRIRVFSVVLVIALTATVASILSCSMHAWRRHEYLRDKTAGHRHRPRAVRFHRLRCQAEMR